MPVTKFALILVVASALLALGSLALSWWWHRMDDKTADPADGDRPWSPEEWAVYNNRLQSMTAIRKLGAALMWGGGVLFAIGMLLWAMATLFGWR
jgi:hypothetical protein